MINADPQELAKFSELAHLWWDTESDFRPLHQINPLRLDWIDAPGRLAGQARARRRLRRRHPGRRDGAARRPRARHRSGDQAAEGGATACDRGRNRRRRIPRSRRRNARRRDAGRIRCRDLHGDARARARPGVDRARLRRIGQTRRLGVLLDDQPQSEGVRVRDRRRRVPAEAAAQGHARVRQVHPARANWRTGAATPGSTCSTRAASSTTR